MIIYILTIFVLFTFALIVEKYEISKSTYNMLTLICYVLLVTQVGLRWETGTDWIPYISHFESSDDITIFILSSFEIGYNFFTWSIRKITSNYTVFLLIHAIFYYFFIFKAFQRISINIFLTLLVFYAFTMGMLGSNRQLIALSICLFSIRFIVDRKILLFSLSIFAAILFHSSAIIFILFYFIDRDVKPSVVVMLLLGALIIGKTQLPIIFFSQLGNLLGGTFANKALTYSDSAADVKTAMSLSVFGLFKRFLFLFLFYINRKRLIENILYYNVLLNGYLMGIVIYLLFSSSLLVMVSRGSLYFNCMEAFLIASQIYVIKKVERPIGIIILLFLSILLFFQSISTYSDLFIPYKGIFINTDFYREMY